MLKIKPKMKRNMCIVQMLCLTHVILTLQHNFISNIFGEIYLNKYLRKGDSDIPSRFSAHNNKLAQCVINGQEDNLILLFNGGSRHSYSNQYFC